jgi:transposase
MKQPEIVDATQSELDELLGLAKASFPTAQYELLERVLKTFAYVMLRLQNAKTSIKRLRQMLFGARTEHKRNVLAALAAVEGAGRAQAVDGTSPATPCLTAKPRVGHGRHGAGSYAGASIVVLDNAVVQPGDSCPDCESGKVYDSPPRTIVKVTGQPPLVATIYKLGRLRCRMCDAIFCAPMPPALAERPKYDAACASMLAVLRYGCGMPFFRLEGLQRALHMPLPDATQWDIVSKAVTAPRAAFEELIRQAAQAPLLHSDDTPMKVLSLMAERTKAESAGIKPAAKAINTSGIVAVLQQHPAQQTSQHKVVLFFTGHDHAGKNMERVLAHRAQDLTPPLQMCDALAANVAGDFPTVVANCLAHGRRQIVDVAENFPEAARRVIEDLGKVYEHDATCRQHGLSQAQRLSFHQDHSKPILDDLQIWMSAQFAQRLVEPNSGLGKALTYLLRHWDKLTLFLHKAGAPLDNNTCEQALKRAILHRKASMFYKTLNGAEVGDIYMSLIHTCRLCDVNPFEYLQALLQHAQQVCRHAARWLPWNYHAQLAPAS